jgi:choice-of-anchor A domain-containing protein
MQQSRIIGLILAPVALALSSHAQAAPFPLSQWDLIDLGNLTSSQDVQGAAWIGGNLNGTGSSYATMLSGPSSAITLEVGGTISGGTVHVHNGSATVNSTPANGQVDMQQGGATLFTNTALNPSLAAMTQALNDASNFFAGLPSNSNVTFPGVQPGPATFTVANNVTQAVFSINASDLFGNAKVQQIQLANDSSAQSIIINVIGATVNDLGSGNFTGGFNSSSTQAKIVWNFINATSITINNRFDGVMLAPNAALTNTSEIDGAVGVASVIQNAEIHLPLSTVPTPEPLAGGMFMLGAMTLLRRRHA